MGGNAPGGGPAPGPGSLTGAAGSARPDSLRLAGRVVRVLPDVPALDRGFDYTVSGPDAHSIEIGTRVRVQLGARRVAGWVVETDVEPEPGVALRPILKVSGLGPNAEIVSLAQWAAWRWAGPVVPFLRAGSSERFVHRLPHAPEPRLPAAPPGLPGGPPLAASPGTGGERSALLAEVWANPGRPVLAMLPPATDRLGSVVALARAVLAGSAGTGDTSGSAGTGDAGGSAGTGDTSEPPGSVLVLVPNLDAVGHLARLLERAGLPVAHGRDGWAMAAAGWSVVLGSRAAAWFPVRRLAAVVVLDAHDDAYREERAPTYDSVEVACERAARAGVPCLLTSATPTTVQYGTTKRWQPSLPVQKAGWPVAEIVDLRDTDPRQGLITDEVARLGRSVLDRSEDAAFVCVLHRRGRARLLACAACGSIARCERCGRAATEDGGLLHCTCGEDRPVVCADCGSTRLKVLRPGVAKVATDMAALLGRPVVEVAGPADGPLPSGRVYVGTEAVLHRLPRAGAVAFLDFDQHLLAPRFSAGDGALAVLGRAARMVAPRLVLPDGSGSLAREASPAGTRLLVQTRLPDHPVLRAVVRRDASVFLDGEVELRRALGLPPCSALALLQGEPAAAHAEAVVGADPGIAAADLGEGRWLLRASTHRELCDALAAPARPKGRLRVEMDPLGV